MAMDIQKGAKIVISECLGAKAGESFLVITDPAKQEIGRALYSTALELGLAAHLLLIPETGTDGAEPHPLTAAAMRAADIVVCPTAFSLTHTEARKAAVAAGARIATRPGFTLVLFGAGAIPAD
jgi:leucyl aminopeptidase (aminopeptidase T)